LLAGFVQLQTSKRSARASVRGSLRRRASLRLARRFIRIADPFSVPAQLEWAVVFRSSSTGIALEMMSWARDRRVVRNTEVDLHSVERRDPAKGHLCGDRLTDPLVGERPPTRALRRFMRKGGPKSES
jgi:hypothetical protein